MVEGDILDRPHRPAKCEGDNDETGETTMKTRRLTYSDNLDILRYSPYPAFSDALIPY